MATVVLFPADLSPPQLTRVDRRVLRLGAAADNDVRLTSPGALPHHAHLLYERSTFTLTATDGGAQILVNGKRKRSVKLAHGDVVQLGEDLIRFVLYDEALHELPGGDDARRGGPRRDADRKNFEALHRFSAKLMEAYDLDALFETLLDELIGLTGAQKAFLLLTTGGSARVQAARNIDRETLDDEASTVSDTIVRRVLETGEPLIVADALSHEDFKSSRSVLSLKLSSVMCVPLVARGATLGLFYLGNDNAVNLFGPELLEVLRLFASQAALILDNALARHELASHVTELERQVSEKRFGEIIGACDAMRDIFKKVSRVATTDISVLVEGETGTGKELVAHAIHERSNRADGPFVVINCGAIPDNLLESELFGHVRGAFTGAVSTVQGKFQAASGGTLFLDEIGEMPLALQVKILRAIQEKKVMKVGGTKVEPVDIRIVAATNKHLADEVAAGRFREDLFYRLNVINLQLPPLRERGEDVVLLARYFLSRHGATLGQGSYRLSREALVALRRWRWPGNIRELDNRIKKAVVFCEGGVVQPEDLDLGAENLDRILPLAEARDEWQRSYINRVLAMFDGNRTKTARALEVDPRTIFRHLERERQEA